MHGWLIITFILTGYLVGIITCYCFEGFFSPRMKGWKRIDSHVLPGGRRLLFYQDGRHYFLSLDDWFMEGVIPQEARDYKGRKLTNYLREKYVSPNLLDRN